MNTSNPLAGERLAGTVGPPLPGVTVRIVGDDDAPVAPQCVGSIQVKGPNVFGGYWRMPEKTREEFTADGWFRTGDMGEILANGYVRIVGRAKDLIITGGLNVYPKEVEERIDALPGVAESAVIGIPDADFGEAVTAVVVARPGEAPSERDVIAASSRRRSRASRCRSACTSSTSCPAIPWARSRRICSGRGSRGAVRSSLRNRVAVAMRALPRLPKHVRREHVEQHRERMPQPRDRPPVRGAGADRCADDAADDDRQQRRHVDVTERPRREVRLRPIRRRRSRSFRRSRSADRSPPRWRPRYAASRCTRA